MGTTTALDDDELICSAEHVVFASHFCKRLNCTSLEYEKRLHVVFAKWKRLLTGGHVECASTSKILDLFIIKTQRISQYSSFIQYALLRDEITFTPATRVRFNNNHRIRQTFVNCECPVRATSFMFNQYKNSDCSRDITQLGLITDFKRTSADTYTCVSIPTTLHHNSIADKLESIPVVA